ncbi:restriction endonuclease subunit S (plasmid) [Levilactobacillus brevis]|uniref:restriction endonuclease subunit S n=1 Tax=Levilactobacillus brevis TaxID=1580 RepID=UPI003AB79422
MKDNQAKYPQLRFKGFTDPWEQRKFEYLLDENDGIRRGPFGSALKKECFVSQSDYVVYEQQNAIYNKYETRYNITKDKFEELKKFELKPEDFIMSGAGTIGRISRVPHGIDKGVFNQALIRFRIDNRITDSEYFLQFIRADFMQKKLTSTNPGSAITNLVPMSEVKKWGILVPQINEQSKIGIFFKQLDKTITLHQRKLAKLKELKQGYLQKLFPENGSKFPQLRFSGFADAWEQRKSSAIFHTITDFVANGSFASLRENVSYSDKLDYAIVVRLTDYSNGYKGPFLYTSKSGYDFLKKSSLNPNDILISNVGANAGLVFKAPILDVPMTLGPNSILVRTSDQDREFMYQLMRSTTGEHLIKTQIGISAQPKFNKTEFKQIIFTIPKSQEEQQKIGNLFHELDHTIALHQRKLEKLQELKKGYLQKMFC